MEINESVTSIGYPRWLVFLFHREGLIASFVWGMSEATVFFVVPDVLITLVATFSWKLGLRHTISALSGALVGGALMFQLGTHDFERAKLVVLKVPFVYEKMFARTKLDLEKKGLWTIAEGPAAGIPYKVYAVQAPSHGTLQKFLIVTVFARLERFLLTWAVAALIGGIFRHFLKVKWKPVVVVHAAVWSCFYVFYWALLCLRLT